MSDRLWMCERATLYPAYRCWNYEGCRYISNCTCTNRKMRRYQTDLKLEFAKDVGGMESNERVPNDFRHLVDAAGVRPVRIMD
jgi:hypothetical protein